MFLYNQCFILNLTLFLFHADKNNESRIWKNIQSSTNGTIEHEKVWNYAIPRIDLMFIGSTI